MKKLFTLFAAIFALTNICTQAQVVTTSPAILQEASENVVLTFHADKCGVKDLMNLPQSTGLYTHIGVVTNKSNNSWVYVVTDWNTSNAKNQLTYVAPNTYTFTIGDLRTFFGVKDPSETITKIAFIARTANGSAQTKDLFIDVHEPGFQYAFTHDANSLIFTEEATINLRLDVTDKADLSIIANGTTIASANNAVVLTAPYTLKTTGTHELTAKIVYNGQTYTKTMTATRPLPSAQGTYPGGIPKQGPVRNADGSVTFCIAAPGKTSVLLIPSWNGYQVNDNYVMKYQDYQGNRYFWTTVEGLNETDPYIYYFLVDGMTKVGDPYARLVLDCYSDKWLDNNVYPDRPKYPYDIADDVVMAVYQGNLTKGFNFSDFEIPDHKNLIIYEMLFRDFTGSDNTADGTIAAAMEKIPYLKSLGVNCVELMPVMEFNGNNSWGYNTNFYFALDKAYGSARELQEFVEACHQAGIAVVLDIVFNQSDGLHPWYQMYPIDSNPFYNKTAPHDYSVLNDWKQDNELVKQQWDDALRYWMTEYNVDGFRFDLVKGLGDNASYSVGTEGYNKSRVDNMKRLHAVIKSVKPNGIHINEFLGSAREENEFAADGQLCWNNINGDAMNFSSVKTKNDDGSEANTQMDGFWAPSWGRTNFHMVSYAESHDEQRIGYGAVNNNYLKLPANADARYNRLGLVAATMLMTPGPKMIWQFAELGADESARHADGSNNLDPKKVLWNRLEDTNAAALMKSYCELNSIRLKNPQLFEAENVRYERTGFQNTFSSGRVIRLSNGDSELILIMNPSQVKTLAKSYSANAGVINADNYQVLSATQNVDPSCLSFSGNTVTANLKGNEYIVIGTKNLASVDEVIGDEISGNNVSVTGGNGEIIINGEYTNASVYTLTGNAVGTTNLIPGIYIVNVDGKSHKVVVK